MSFRVEIMRREPGLLIVCEGHLDVEAFAAIQDALEAAGEAGLQAVVKVCRGATADRPVVARLAGYPLERLEVESPFLRSWLEELRATRARAAECGSGERAGSRSELR